MRSRRKILIVLPILFLAVLLRSESGRADIYKYVDERGVLHFTNVPTSTKFELYLITPSEKPAKRAVLKREGKYDPIIKRCSVKYGVDYALAKAIIKVESDFDHRAVSRKGALGLMQLMPETAKKLGVSDPFDPLENIEAGLRFFRYLLVRYHGDVRLALAAYNTGADVVERYGSVPPFPETETYVRRVLFYFELYRRHSVKNKLSLQ